MLEDLAVGDIAFINHRRCQSGWRIAGRRPPDWHVLALAVDGHAVYQMDDARLELQTGDSILLPPDCQRAATTDPQRPWTFASAGFRLIGNTTPLPRLASPGTAPAVRLFAEALAAWQSGQALLARARLSELLHLHASGGTIAGTGRLAAVLAGLERRPDGVAPSVEVLARQAGLSPSRFRVLFRATTGLPLHRWLNRRRLAHARALLLAGGLSVGEAAAAVGFDDQHHFSRLFRQHFGMPPSACRPD